MCGLVGMFSNRSVRAEPLREQIAGMTSALRHRGPDDVGLWVDAPRGLAFGFRRLSIIDLSDRGHQPMRSASGRFTVVFNGEVYNFEEIRQELEGERSPRFRGHSDTEVLLAAFERWGIRNAVKRFTGMFAIAVWDEQDRSVSLIRDRLGIKPLYFYQRHDLLLFGSELKAMLRHPRFDRTLDAAALGEYFRYLYVPAPRTIFAHARKLEPGCILTIRDPASPLPSPESYWSLERVADAGAKDPLRGSDRDLVDGLEKLLQRAVSLRMRSDVPFGALLSGGVDSSSVTALMQEAASRPIRTFSIGFDEEKHDESAQAAAVARHLGTDHTPIRLSGADALATVPRIAGIFDEPFADPSQIPTLLVCQLARRDVTVALSGDGGDELFAGYNRYLYGDRAIRWALRIPVELRRAVQRPLSSVSSERWNHGFARAQRFLPQKLEQRLVGEKMEKLTALIGYESAPSMYRSLMSAWQDPGSLLAGWKGAGPDAIDHAFGLRGIPDAISRMQLADQANYLPDDLLAKVDRVSMSVSLEVRVPLLDHHVVEYSWRLPQGAKIRRGRGKWVLRELLYRRVPPSLVDRPKMGFSVPLDAWLRGPLRDWAEDLLSPDRLRYESVLNVEVVRSAWTSFLAGHNQQSLGIWTILMFEAWRESWFSTPMRHHAAGQREEKLQSP